MLRAWARPVTSCGNAGSCWPIPTKLATDPGVCGSQVSGVDGASDERSTARAGKSVASKWSQIFKEEAL